MEMNTDPYQYRAYNEQTGWSGQESAREAVAYPQKPAPTGNGERPRQRESGVKPGSAAARMPKARAMQLVDRLKKALVVASLVSFSAFGGVIAYHQVNTVTTAAHTSSTTTQSTQTPSSQNTNSNSSDNQGFFGQQGGSNVGSGTSSQSSSSGSSASSQNSSSGSSSSGQSTSSGSSNAIPAPVTGSHTS